MGDSILPGGITMVGDGQPIRIVVPGTPQGKGRPRAFAIKHGPRAGQVAMHTPAKTRTYEGIIASLGLDAMRGRAPLTQPLQLTLVAYCPIPDSWPRWKRAEALEDRIRPTSKPDMDNVLKALSDALNEVVWADDSRVCAIRMAKHYSDQPRLEATIEVLAAQACQDATRADKQPDLLRDAA